MVYIIDTQVEVCFLNDYTETKVHRFILEIQWKVWFLNPALKIDTYFRGRKRKIRLKKVLFLSWTGSPAEYVSQP